MGVLYRLSYTITSESHGKWFFIVPIILFPPLGSGTYPRLLLPRRLIPSFFYRPSGKGLSHVRVDHNGVRTHDLLIAKQALYRLSYGPIKLSCLWSNSRLTTGVLSSIPPSDLYDIGKRLAGRVGLEPTTTVGTGQLKTLLFDSLFYQESSYYVFYQLNYLPVFFCGPRWDSNPRPSDCQSDALPTELRAQMHVLIRINVPSISRFGVSFSRIFQCMSYLIGFVKLHSNTHRVKSPTYRHMVSDRVLSI